MFFCICDRYFFAFAIENRVFVRLSRIAFYANKLKSLLSQNNSESLSNSMRPLVLKGECSESPQDVSDAQFKDSTKVAPDAEPTHGIFDCSIAVRVA